MPRDSDKNIYSKGANAYLAPYASIPENTKGRLYKEAEDPGRSAYQRDRDRIVHSAAFRRLEYKTQVFVYHEGDHYRTRLTHSLEVAQLARSIARELLLDEDLAEAIALSHDLGHPPFGHAGEEALHDAMKDFGGFDHNAQTLRAITKLESKYAGFDGLNLTWECLEGIAKHNGPVKNPPRAMQEYNKKHNLRLDTYPNLEAQVASIADDIAYNSHDIEDGLRARLFKVQDLKEVPLIGEVFSEVSKKHKNIEESRLIHEAKRRMINLMVKDLVAETKKNITKNKIRNVDDVRNAGELVAKMSKEMSASHKQIKKFLFDNMYRHYKVNRMTSKAKRVVKDLFDFYINDLSCLPTHWRNAAEGKTKKEAAVVIADFIAGMTDRFALEEHKRIFDLSYKLIGG